MKVFLKPIPKIVLVTILVFINPVQVFAQQQDGPSETSLRARKIYFIETTEPPVCTTTPTAANNTSGSNVDYAGRTIFNDAQMAAIRQNQPIYEQAAGKADIPWQVIAVIHKREHNLLRDNPSNGQGIYQFVNRNGGPYPTGPVSEAEFLRQTILAAEFIKSKTKSNLAANRNLTATSPTSDAVKDTFFSYNGRAKVYADQAARLGFNPSTQPFEGSPYVMNKADAQRDPEVNTTTWGQIKNDGGRIVYPANRDHGAYVMYAALSGIATTSSGTCGPAVSSDLAAKVVQIARQELALKAKSSDGSYIKYTGGVEASDAWCAYFVSWVFQQAGRPFPGGSISTARGIMDYGISNGLYHPKGEAGFTPQPGDIAIYQEGVDPFPSHTNIVIAYDPSKQIYTSIGGNESSTVQEGNYSLNLAALTGFVRLK